jgi:hypothetical protein
VSPIDLVSPLNTKSIRFEGIAIDMIVFEDIVPDVGKYSYYKSKRRISIRSNKRQKVEEVSKIEPKERSISWPLANDHKENAIEITSTLLSFVRDNSIKVGELGDALDNHRVDISQLQDHLKQQKDQMEMGFIQQIMEKEYLYNIEVDKMKNIHEKEVTKLKEEYQEQFKIS